MTPSPIATDAALAAAAASQAAVLALVQIIVQSLTALGLAWIGLKTAKAINDSRVESALARAEVIQRQAQADTKVGELKKDTDSIKEALVAVVNGTTPVKP